MENLNFDRKNLRKFGITMGCVFILINSLIFIKHHHASLPASVVSFVFFVLAAFIPAYLRPFYSLWMKFAFILGWINTRLILIIIFYLIFTPIGLMMRIFGQDALDKKLDKTKISYWKKRENKAFDPACFERQF